MSKHFDLIKLNLSFGVILTSNRTAPQKKKVTELCLQNSDFTRALKGCEKLNSP